jgi:hypothetical protein
LPLIIVVGRSAVNGIDEATRQAARSPNGVDLFEMPLRTPKVHRPEVQFDTTSSVSTCPDCNDSAKDVYLGSHHFVVTICTYHLVTNQTAESFMPLRPSVRADEGIEMILRKPAISLHCQYATSSPCNFQLPSDFVIMHCARVV